jgi:undecaprenyl diphosphate synthase
MISLFNINMNTEIDAGVRKNVVTCIGFIMDGNRRWAKQQGLSTEEGHRAGVEVFERVVRDVHEAHIPHAVFYAFSTENWRRAPEEVQSLMIIFMEVLQQRQGVRVQVIGDRSRFSQSLQQAIKKAEEDTQGIQETTIWIALSYGGRAEIIAAVNAVSKSGHIVTEAEFENYLWSKEMPDPDLIIRTGGEQRLSNFLPWQSVYSELMFTDTYWPAFTKTEFLRMLDEYEKRQRRHGV